MPFVIVESIARSSETETGHHPINEDLVSIETYPAAAYNNENMSEDVLVEFTNKECSTDDLSGIKSVLKGTTMNTT